MKSAVQKTETALGLFVKFIGVINESTEFPALNRAKEVKIDLHELIFINSVGTRSWCVWINELNNLADRIIVMGCPPIMVKNMSSIEGFYSPKMELESVRIPFISESADEKVEKVAIFGKDFNEDGLLHDYDVRDSKGALMLPDFNPQNFFRFLKK